MCFLFADLSKIKSIYKKVEQIVNDAVLFAEESPFPDSKDLYKSVYKQQNYPFIK